MSGFPVPAKAKEMAARAIALGRDPEARWEDHWTTGSKLRFLDDAENALAAALPVLAADAKQRILEATGHALTDEEAQWYADVAFGVASPSTKETQ